MKSEEYIAIFFIVGYTINMFLATIIHEDWVLYCLWIWVFIGLVLGIKDILDS